MTELPQSLVDYWGTLQPEYILIAGYCPYQPPLTGSVEPIVLEGGEVVLYCESCGTVWVSLDEYHNGDGVAVRAPESVINEHLHKRKGTSRYATAEDVAHLRAEWKIVPNWRLTNGQ